MIIPRVLISLIWAGTSVAWADISVIDDTGREVRLERPAQRIVTLAPHATELVTTAGAGDLLVAAAQAPGMETGRSDVPQFGGPGRLDRERLLELRPDLVVAWQSGNRHSDLAWIARNGIALYRSEPLDLLDIETTIGKIGHLTGRQDKARVGADRFRDAATTRCRGLPRLPVFVLVWRPPVLSLGGRHWINSVLQRSGYRNRLEEIDRGIVVLAPEAVVAQRDLPQITLRRAFDDSENDRLASLLARPGPRLAEAVQLLCAQRLRAAQ